MPGNKVQKADGPYRDAKGRLKKGHKLGGRKPQALREAFADAGLSIAEARRLVIQQTVKNARAGVDAAVERLAKLVLPATRPTPGVFKGATTASERASAVVAALETGAITPSEAGLIAKGALEHLAQAEEWKEVAERLDRLAAAPPQGALGPAVRVVHVNGGSVQVPRASTPAVVDADVGSGPDDA